jgi:exopolyphosphatase / guanosine-5'-triphosphate,3'-diphosphate pyrophosphatase
VPSASVDSELVAVLDMGASAIRLVIAENTAVDGTRVIEEASRGILLGRDVFSSGTIRARTIDAALAALDGFREVIDHYGVRRVRAVATSAVREARNADMFLDRIWRRSAFSFRIINEAEESRLVFLAVRDSLRNHRILSSRAALVVEVGGGSTSLTLLRQGEPIRSGVYALGSVRLRQQLELRRHPHELQIALLKRYIANIVQEIRLEMPLDEIADFVVIGGDVRFAARQIDGSDGDEDPRELDREMFLAFCSEVERLDDDRLVERFRLPAVEAETLVPALLVYRTLLVETAAQRITVSDATLRAGVLLDLLEPSGQPDTARFEAQVLASAESVGERYRFDRAHGWHVAGLAARLFDALRDEHGLGDRERLLLQVAGLLHDIGLYVSIRGHHKHSQYLLSAVQIFGLSNEDMALVSNLARYHRRAMPQLSHPAFIALDRDDRLIVSKLASLLRVANALDAEHLQKVRNVQLVRQDAAWLLELEAAGDITMEQMAASARADMLSETFGRQVRIRPAGVIA